jgi:hypothetical protein
MIAMLKLCKNLVHITLQMLMTKSRVLTSMIWCNNVDLLYLIVW